MPADAQKWQYLNRTLSAGEKMVDDKDAANGQAIIAESGTTNKNTHWRMDHIPRTSRLASMWQCSA